MHVMAIALLAMQAASTPQSLLPAIREQIRRDGHAQVFVSFYMPPADLGDMTAKADLIVDVVTQPCKSYLTKDESAIFSDCAVTVERVLKGPGGLTTITVRRNTGELTIDGAPVVAYEGDFPAFKAGERYVLFLVAYQGSYVVVHSAHGAFRVADGKVRQVMEGKWNEEHGEMSLEDFHALVRSKIK